MFNGGYLMVSKTDTDLYKKLNNALTLGKPVLFYEDATTCYYIDTISKSGDDIVLTKGGKTITIETDGDITETGDIQPSSGDVFNELDLSSYENGETYPELPSLLANLVTDGKPVLIKPNNIYNNLVLPVVAQISYDEGVYLIAFMVFDSVYQFEIDSDGVFTTYTKAITFNE